MADQSIDIDAVVASPSTFVPRTPFERFIAPAHARPAIWRVLVGLLIVVAIYALWIALVVMIYGAVLLAQGRFFGFELVLTAVALGSTPGAVLTLLASFGGLFLGTFAAVRLLHKRSLASVIGRSAKVMRDFACLLYTSPSPRDS